MTKTSHENQENKTSKLHWFLFALIPLLVVIVATLIISMIAGVNVFEKAKEVGSNIPIVSNLINEDTSKKTTDLAEKIVELEGQVRDRETLIAQLESKIGSKDEAIDRLQLERNQLDQSMDELQAMQDENKRAFKDIIRTYETMSAKKAAPIISEMKDAEALQILANIKADALAGILEKMEPKEAARFTEMLATHRAEQ